MLIPIVLVSVAALSDLQPYGSLFWLAGVLFLWLTRYTHQLGQRWGRAYYGLSVAVRPLGVLLIAFGWLVLYAPAPESKQAVDIGLFQAFSRGGILPAGMSKAGAVLCVLAIVLFFALGVWSVLKLGIRRSFLYRHVDDRLLTSGPYALVRHPQFLSSLGIALFGVLLYGRPETWGGTAGFTTLLMNWAMFTLSLWVLSIIEDRELAAHFGDEYLEYQKRVPRIVPN